MRELTKEEAVKLCEQRAAKADMLLTMLDQAEIRPTDTPLTIKVHEQLCMARSHISPDEFGYGYCFSFDCREIRALLRSGKHLEAIPKLENAIKRCRYDEATADPCFDSDDSGAIPHLEAVIALIREFDKADPSNP